jgi:hypothetical protein
MKPASNALCALAAAAAAACSNLKVKLPGSDSTPPALVWNVYNFGTGVQADHPGSPTLNAKWGESYRVTLKAVDPQGVKQIQLNPSLGSGEMAWMCVDPPGGENLAQSKTATLGPMTQNLSPDSNGYVLTNIFLVMNVDLTLTCQPEWIFVSGTAKLTGRASNYFGGTTTEVITFNVAP